jgi:hypothetical protein
VDDKHGPHHGLEGLPQAPRRRLALDPHALCHEAERSCECLRRGAPYPLPLCLHVHDRRCASFRSSPRR